MESSKNKIVIAGAIANTTELTTNELLELLKLNLPENQIYKFKGEPGKITSAAFDWQVVGNIADILGILSFFWMVYKECINSKNKDNKDVGIALTIINNKWDNNFFIGGHIQSKEQLISEFQEFVKSNRIDQNEVKNIIHEIENSAKWEKFE